MALLDQGWTQKQVAAELGVTPAAVCQWVKARRDGGDAALAARPHPGRKPKLDARQRRQLQKMLLRGPRQNGYANDLWTLPRIAELIQRRFGVTYDPSGVWHVMHRMGWSAQKPQRQARERDDQAVAQ